MNRRSQLPTAVRTPSSVKRKLQIQVDQRGPKSVAAEIPLHADTLRDLLAGKTNPHEKTIRRIESYLKRHKPND